MEDDIKISKYLETWYAYKKYSDTINSDRVFNYAYHALLHLFIINVLCKYDCERYSQVIKSNLNPIISKAFTEHKAINKSYKDQTFDSYMKYFSTNIEVNIKNTVIKILKHEIRMQSELEKNMGIYKHHDFVSEYFSKLRDILTSIIKLLEKTGSDNCSKDFENLQSLSLKLMNYYIANIRKVFMIISKDEDVKTVLSYGKTLYSMTIPELKKKAAELRLSNYSKLKKLELIQLIQQNLG
jgi:hypothetical protein